MLNKDTLELIIANAAAAQALPQTHTPAVALPDGVTVRNLEQYAANRARFRGELATSSIKDFAEYVNMHTHPIEQVAAFVDQDSMRCRVFFNLGDQEKPGHGDDTAMLKLKPTAAYAALQAIAGKAMSQRDLAEWMEDWAHLLKAFDGDKDLSVLQAIAAVRNITIKAGMERTHSESNFGGSRSAMDEIEAKSQDTLPTELSFTTVPYEGLLPQTITLRLSVITGDKPQLKLRWVREEAQREEIAQDFKRVIQAEIGGTARVTLGTFTLAA